MRVLCVGAPVHHRSAPPPREQGRETPSHITLRGPGSARSVEQRGVPIAGVRRAQPRPPPATRGGMPWEPEGGRRACMCTYACETPKVDSMSTFHVAHPTHNTTIGGPRERVPGAAPKQREGTLWGASPRPREVDRRIKGSLRNFFTPSHSFMERDLLERQASSWLV